ncbi:MAG: DUF4337 domain-containing protein [Bacteroidota bacterium]
MEEIEVPTEHLHETIHEKVEHSESKWFPFVAISTALMAVFAAISGLLAGHHSDEAVISQIKASDQWSFYQAKGIKAEIKTLEIHAGIADSSAVGKYKTEQEEIKTKAEEFQKESSYHLDKHSILAKVVTLFQIAIAISAISILTKKKWLWLCSLVLMLVAMGLFSSAFI